MLSLCLSHISSSYFDDLRGANILIVGDGDFSFSRAVSDTKVCKSLIATTIDAEPLATRAFESSQSNAHIIRQCGYNVRYEVDATAISKSFGKTRFEVIIWNFPHRIGKQNIKYNRMLLTGFLLSAQQALAPGGKVKLALCKGQSVSRACNKEQWDRSWKLLEAAAEARLLVTEVTPFDRSLFKGYTPQGHRGHGGSFFIDHAQGFTLMQPGIGVQAAQCTVYAHELHLLSPSINPDLLTLEDMAKAAIYTIVSSLSYDPIWSVVLVDLYRCPSSGHLCHVLQISYGSLTYPVTRRDADNYRVKIEQALPSILGFTVRHSKLGGRVSQPCGWYVSKALKCTQAAKDILSLDVLEARSQDGEDIPSFKHAHADSSEEVKAIARKLWRRKVGIVVQG
jgi:hypothetical protein